MYPILYEQITAGTVPQHRGLGTLSDCISCEIEQQRNGIYELVMEYPISGIHAEEIATRRIIKAKPNMTDDPQLFRIDRVGKVMNGRFTVYGKHISYDLSGYEITAGTASGAVAAAALLDNAAPGWTITTDKTTSGTFKIATPGSVRSYFAGREGSFLDTFGTAEIKYDNFNINFKQHAGQDRGEVIHYGKNLLELSQELDSSNLYTHVLCFYKNQDDPAVVGDKVATGLTLDIPRTLTIDVSSEYQEAPTTQQLTQRATDYKNNNNLTTPTNNITLDFVQSEKLTNRVDLCDTVTVIYEAIGITRAQMKCIRTKWDCIKEKYIETEFGDTKFDLADNMVQNNKEIKDKPSTSYMEDAVKHATEMITGNLGGYVILHDSNGDGEPDEILIMNTADINTATKVWRWNKNGLGYSSTGYGGTYGTAMTADGKIVADFIKTGTLNADLIKAGVLQDAEGNSSINMSNGVATMTAFQSKGSFYLVDSSGNTKAQLAVNINGTWLNLYAAGSNNSLVRLWAQDANAAGVFQLLRTNGNLLVEAGTTGLGGGIGLHNNDNKVNAEFRTGDAQQGEMLLYGQNGKLRIAEYGNDGGGVYNLFNNTDKCAIAAWANGEGIIQVRNAAETTTIELAGQSGRVLCVSCVQTSSRKVKDNIKPMDPEEARKILDLDAVQFDYKNKDQGTDKRGFIAEDVEEILPNLVIPEENGRPASMDYIQMIPYLQEIIKEQQATIEDLQKRVEALEKKNTK
jgi:phage minor structural protein